MITILDVDPSRPYLGTNLHSLGISDSEFVKSHGSLVLS